MEMLFALLVVSIIIAASMPLISQLSTKKTGTDKNVIACIKLHASDTPGWYEADGDTKPLTDSTFTSDSKCLAAVTDTLNNEEKAYNTATYFADKGTAAQKTTAKQILRAACDSNGDEACDYFINKCWKDGSSITPFCDEASSYTDLTYYLKLPAATTNTGATYMVPILQGYVLKPVTNILSEVLADCQNRYDPPNKELACDIASPQTFIEACNAGNPVGCQVGYDYDFNRSCNQIKSSWPGATDGTYKLTYNGAPPTATVSVPCKMTSVASAAISGCDYTPSVPDDCNYGYNNDLNKSCNQLYTAWTTIPNPTSASHKLTYPGLPYTGITVTNAPVSITSSTTTCNLTNLNLAVITGCDAATPVPGDCTYGYDHNLNKGCNQVFTAMSPTTGTVTHKLTAAGAGSPVSTSCTMTTGNIASAAITGCNANNGNDCAHGYTNSENRSCANILATWPAYPNPASYNITSSTTVWASSTCPAAGGTCELNIASGTTLADGTIKAYNWNHVTGVECSSGTNCKPICTTPANLPSSYYWNDGSANYVATGVTNNIDGLTNTNTLAAINSPSPAPYAAARACYNLSANTHTDWYLPSGAELGHLWAYDGFGSLVMSGDNWSSTEEDAEFVTTYSWSGFSALSKDTDEWNYPFDVYVRCIRRGP
jgi:hypothetical protein